MKLLILSTLVFGHCASMSVTCDNDYSCTVTQLTGHHLRDLIAHPFENVSNLKLRDTHLPVLVVSSLHPNLHQLSLERCQIDRLIVPTNCLLNFLTLDKTFGRIRTFPGARLRYLSVSKSEISSLLPALINLTALETIRLSNVRIPTFDFDMLCDMRQLFIAELNYNRIEQLHLSPNRTCCQNLTEIDLSFNRLTTLDLALINRLKGLKRLRLSNNKIAELNGMLELPYLLELNLSGNRIKIIDLCRWNIEMLMDLNVNDNQIDRMPSCIERLEHLMSISIADNLLVEVDFAPFAKLGLLHTDFSRNRISVVHNYHVLSRDVCLMVEGNPISNSSYICKGIEFI
uniref:Leucine rich immune protein (Coil-less) n=1 Tax=Anopheles minimus TaxID=112268 RepID=A0A182W6Y2_9DIPT